MIEIDLKYLGRPITKEMAINDFKFGEKVLVVLGEPAYGWQWFLPTHHDLEFIEQYNDPDARWYADCE